MGEMGEMTTNTKPEPVLAWELLECSGAQPRAGTPQHPLYERRSMTSSEAAAPNRDRVLTTQRWYKGAPRDTSDPEGESLRVDADGSRGDLGRTLVPEALVDDRDSLRAALHEACDIADAVLMPNPRVSRTWYEQHADFRESIIRVRELRDRAGVKS